MTVPYSFLRLNKVFAEEANFPVLNTDVLNTEHVKAETVTVDSKDSTSSTLTIQNGGGSGASVKIDMKPWASRPSGAPLSVQTVDRDFSADTIVWTAPFGSGGNPEPRKRFILNDNGLTVGGDQYPSVPLDVYGQAKFRNSTELNTLKFASQVESYEVKHIFFMFSSYASSAPLSDVLVMHGIPDNPLCILSCTVMIMDWNDKTMNTHESTAFGGKYAVPWWIEQDTVGGVTKWYLKVTKGSGEASPDIARVHLICSTTPVTGTTGVPIG